MRAFVNVWLALFLIQVVAILLWYFLGAVRNPPGIELLILLNRVFFLGALPAVVALFSFKLGIIKCPSCGLRFDTRLWVPIDAECANCGYNIRTISRRGDF